MDIKRPGHKKIFCILSDTLVVGELPRLVPLGDLGEEEEEAAEKIKQGLKLMSRVAKCHRYGRYICVKILKSWGKKCVRIQNG